MMLSSAEDRFTITYCPDPALGVTQADIESVNFKFGDVKAMLARYDPAVLKPGVNVMDDGEEIYFVPQPASGLWSDRKRFEASAPM